MLRHVDRRVRDVREPKIDKMISVTLALLPINDRLLAATAVHRRRDQ
jgi:hypothetical protein